MVVFTLTFFITRLAPGDPVRILAGMDDPSPEMMQRLYEKYGLDKPIHIQLVNYLKNVLRGDMENSILYNEPVTDLIKQTLGTSLLLALSGALVAMLVGTLLGLYSAQHRGGVVDVVSSATTYVFNAMPSFWLGLVLIVIFATRLGLFPTSGMYNMRANYTGFQYLVDVLHHLALPMATLTLIQIPAYFKISKSSVTQVMTEDYITTFRAAGMAEKVIFRRYVFKNAILPTVTMFGISLAYLITGSTLIETVFAWPGMGRLMMGGITSRDYPLIMAIYLMLSVTIAIMMIITDLVYAIIDPRIRYQ